MTKKYIISKKVVVGLFTLFVVMVGFLFSNREMVFGYVCPAGTSCSTEGSITDSVYRPGCEVWNDDDSAPRCLQYGCIISTRMVYSCSGTDSNCIGQSAAYYYTYDNCINGIDPRYSYCCNGGSSGGGESCGCGTQECESYDCECTYIGCKRISDPSENCYEYRCDTTPPCIDCSLGSCPTPLTDTGSAEYILSNYRSCLKGGSCAGMKYGDCYENPNAFPTSTINIYPVAGETTLLGCQSLTYSGTEINNPINMIATATDTNGESDIEAISVWLKTDTSIPNTPQYIDSTASSSTANTFTNNSWGFMMHKEGSSWVPYIVNRDVEWVKASYTNGRFAIKGPSSGNMVFVEINGVTPSGNNVTLDFDLDFEGIAEANKVADGNYNLFTMVNDVFGFTPYDNYPSTVTKIGDYFNPGQIRSYNSWVDSTRNWSIDLTVPEANISEVTTEYPTYIKFRSSINDAVGLYGFVSNLYVSQDVEGQVPVTSIEVLERTPALGTVTLASTPFSLPNYSEELENGSTIGNLANGFMAKATGIATEGESESVRVNIGTNREDSIMYFVTAFDMACNVGRDFSVYDIEDWIVTYGGLVYSAQGVHFVAKDIDDFTHWEGVSLLNRLNPLFADISSEMYGNITSDYSSLEKEETTNAYSIGQFSAYRVINFYKDIKTTFERRELGISNLVERIPTPPGSTLVGNLGGGSIKVMDVQGDLTVGSPATAFNCNGKGLFFVKDNLIINGDITNGNLKGDACIFVVNGNVTINAGKNTGSAITLGYDQINAYILANGNVTITPDPNFDGLYINGGIQSLGDSGILMDRYLGLNYRTTHPAFVVDHNSKYGVLSTKLIGNPIDLVKVEVGFKPF